MSKIEDDGFERLFRVAYPKVHAIASRILHDSALAEDVAQEAFISFHKNHSASESFAAPWLYAASAHLALNTLRQRERRTLREVKSLFDSSLDVSDQAITNLEIKSLQRALAALSPQDASLVVLRHSGLSYSELAQSLNLNVNSVGKSLMRAEEKLKKEMFKNA